MQLLDSHIEGAQHFPPAQRMKIYRAIIEYLRYGTEPGYLTGEPLGYFIGIFPELERTRKKSEAGRIGGSKRQSKQQSKQSSKTEANRQANRQANGEANRQANRQANGEANRQANGEANRQANGEANGEANRQANGEANRQANAKQDKKEEEGKEKERTKEKEKEEGEEPKEKKSPYGDKEKKGRFRPPTPGEVRAYAAEKGYSIDADYFCDYWQSKGWMRGNTKMKDWMATVRNWVRNAKEAPGKDREERRYDWSKYA